MLPKHGSKWRAATGDLNAAWSEDKHLASDLIDELWKVVYVLKGIDGLQPPKITRPQDKANQQLQIVKSRSVSKKIKETKWVDING